MASSPDAGQPLPAYRPDPYAADKPRRKFHRGYKKPRGVVWFGIRSFSGHIRHFIASAIATEDVDSRDWMYPDEPRMLVARIGRHLGAANAKATVTETLGRDVWIDYLADTGDDVSVSEAVAGLVFAPYELPDPANPGAHLEAPRGDILLFGGDTAYPVATSDEITDRVCVPFNKVLEQRDDRRPRVLLGIPGNHDWYDGLDGFGRMFRRHVGDDTEVTRTSRVGTTRTMLSQYTNWARAFVTGGQVDKAGRCDLVGYMPVQEASYFALPLAPTIAMLAVDRQLKTVDFRQKAHFSAFLNQNLAVTPWVVLPDPVVRWGEEGASGKAMTDALDLKLDSRPHLVLSGDIHHYRRDHAGPAMHVTAGGGGAFLHPAPIRSKAPRPPEAEWPDGPQCRALLPLVPWKVGIGRSGLLPHLVFAALFAPTMAMGIKLDEHLGLLLVAPIVIATIVTIVYALIGGVRRGNAVTWGLALVTGIVTGALPLGAAEVLQRVLPQIGVENVGWVVAALAVVTAAYAAAFIFGAYLALLTWLGLENTQAFTALDHPGFKHFVRLRVRGDGSAVDGWCIGLADPLANDAKPVLVDAFTWQAR